MLHRYIVAIGAGCAAALLFIVSAQSSALAMALAYLAPLPIMIATLGWGLDAGAIAAAISVAALALLCRAIVRRCCSPPLSPVLRGAWLRSPSPLSRDILARKGLTLRSTPRLAPSSRLHR